MTRYYKWLADDGPVYGVGDYASPGEWQERIGGDLVPCEHGYHVCTRDQVARWCGTELIEVEIDESDMIHACDKCVVRTWREIRRFEWSREDMVAYAHWCARSAERRARVSAAAADTASVAARAADDADAAAAAAAYAARAAAHAAVRAAVTVDVDAGHGQQLAWIEDRIGESLL